MKHPPPQAILPQHPQHAMPRSTSFNSEQDADGSDDGLDGENSASKRQKHNIAERRRTTRINLLFEELSKVLSERL